MAGIKNRRTHLPKIDRGCERSRLEEELLAAAYELLTPILRRLLPVPDPDRQPTGTSAGVAKQPHAQAGGRRA